eukprot:6197056-Pleurochrysis_carterae.AAC.2
MTLLDTLAAHLPDVARVYKTGKIHQSKWRDDFDQVCLEVFSMLEENDRMEWARTPLTPSAAPCAPRPSLLEMTCPACATSYASCVSRWQP